MIATQTPRSPERTAFYEKIARRNLAPLWESMANLITRTPATPCLPAHWRYAEMRDLVLEAGALITAKEAERRVLILENPGLPGQQSVTHSLYAGLQLVMPGEVAPAHRHSQSALRLILEGSGAYTTVEGERATMSRGDFVITPSGTWHDHGNPSDRPVIWLDGLDIPLVRFFDAGFAEHGAEESQRPARPEGDSLARYGNNLAPVDWRPQSSASPIFSYPYERTRAALEAIARGAAPDPHHGHKLRFVNPATGDHVMPTMGAFIQDLPAGFATAPYRSTDSTVYAVVEGEGRTQIADTLVEWREGDVFVAPSWFEQTHFASVHSVLFSFSDRPVQEKLGLWAERRGAAA